MSKVKMIEASTRLYDLERQEAAIRKDWMETYFQYIELRNKCNKTNKNGRKNNVR